MKQILSKINWATAARVMLVLTLTVGQAALALHTADAALTKPACSGVNCTESPDVNAFIVRIINWILTITLAVDVLMMIIGGFLYITSAGNEDRAKKGRTTVINAIIGLVIIILAWVIANVVANFFVKDAPA